MALNQNAKELDNPIRGYVNDQVSPEEVVSQQKGCGWPFEKCLYWKVGIRK